MHSLSSLWFVARSLARPTRGPTHLHLTNLFDPARHFSSILSRPRQKLGPPKICICSHSAYFTYITKHNPYNGQIPPF
jgi:hypothetical protein